MSRVSRALREIDVWCATRSWIVRSPALLFFAWVWVRHASEPTWRSPFGGLNLGIHELGHFVFGLFGDVPGALGGSLLQCLVPLVGMAMFLTQRDWFAVAFAWGWLATNLFEVATYAGDAVAMRLPLVTPGGGHPIHDWNYILGALGWLRHTELIAGACRTAAHASMAVGLGGMGWLAARMITWSGPRGAAFRARRPLRPKSRGAEGSPLARGKPPSAPGRSRTPPGSRLLSSLSNRLASLRSREPLAGGGGSGLRKATNPGAKPSAKHRVACSTGSSPEPDPRGM